MVVINWILVGAIIAAVVITLVVTIVGIKKRKSGQVKQKNQTTYNNATQNETRTEQIVNNEITLEKGDIVIAAQKTMIASKNGTLKPGKYSILATESNTDAFNVRIGKFVKEYHHGDVVVIADGEEVTPTSHKIILR